jgi:DNA-directed RNA polymerase subunit M/transcription elongation factor TFIIS
MLLSTCARKPGTRTRTVDGISYFGDTVHMKKVMHKDHECSKECEKCGSVFYRDKRNTWAYWSLAKFCSRKCSAAHGADIAKAKTPTLAHAFWRKVDKRDDLSCWSWSGTIDQDGYALLPFRGKLYRANRVALMVTGVNIDSDKYACHRCGNQWCVNPSHIYAGTASQNNNDKIRHGTHRQGSDMHSAKLSEQQVSEIRLSKESCSKIAQKYGVSPSNIKHIKNRRTWKHVL